MPDYSITIANQPQLDRLKLRAGGRGRTLETEIKQTVVKSLRDPVLVWQVGKVASTAIKQALAGADDWMPVQIHHLSEHYMTAIRDFYERAGKPAPIHLNLSEMVLEMWDRLPRPTPLISAVRDPVARNVSAYFEVFEDRPVARQIDLETAHEDDALVDDIVKKFVDEYEHMMLPKWFEHELAGVAGFDITALEFDREQACATADNERFRLIVIRAEDDDARKAAAIQRFLDVPQVTVGRANVGGQKDYSKFYRRVLERITIPERVLDEVYGHPVCRAFYDDAEIEAFRRRWRGGD